MAALAFARTSGVLADGIAGNFENEPLPPAAIELLRGVDLVISTGAVGYVSQKTFGKVMAAIGEPRPWVAAFVLRMFPYTSVQDTLSASGLTTEALASTTFIQRRFASERECREVLARLRSLGIDPTGKETEGLLHANFYLSRPAADIASRPLPDLVSVTQGARHPFGRRYVSRSCEAIHLVR